jgi:hypothetical protein
MKTSLTYFFLLPLAFSLASAGQSSPQSETPQSQTVPQPSPKEDTATHSKRRSAGGDIGSGSGDIGKGVGKGAGKAAEGVGKGAGDLVTLHPVGAAANVGKGAGEAGKDVGVGAVKGTGKIGKGTGKLIAKPFHHSKKIKNSDEPRPSDASPR